MLKVDELPRVDAVVIGSSAGAIEVLSRLLPAISPGAPVPVLVVVHLPRRGPSLLVELFAGQCRAQVREPLDGEPVGPGIWFAPANYHLLVERERRFALSLDEPVNFSRPSIDVLFESAADCYGSSVAAIVLTGASADGADGVRAIRKMGGLVLAQDPRTAEASIMPAAAVKAGALAVTVSAISLLLSKLTSETTR